MKLGNKESGREWEVEITRGEFSSVSIKVKDPNACAYISLAQVDALALARVLEEQVKENRRR